jgi:hypothetical protein
MVAAADMVVDGIVGDAMVGSLRAPASEDAHLSMH